MRVALIANPTVSNVLGASEFHTFKENAQYITAEDPEAYFYFMLPERYRGQRLPPIERTEYVYYNSDNQLWYDAQAAIPSTFVAMFHARTGKFPIDAVWCSRTTVCAILSRQLQDFRCGPEQIPVFVDDFKVIDYEDAVEQTTMEEDFIGNAMAYMNGYTFFDGVNEFALGEKLCSRFLTAQGLERFYDRSIVTHSGVDFPLVDRVTKGIRKRQRFTFFVGGRLNGKKRPKLLLEALDAFFSKGHDVDVVVCTPTKEKATGVLGSAFLSERFPNVEINYGCRKEDYLRIAASCHAFLNASMSEGYATGYVELMVLGQIPLFPRLPWVRNLLRDNVKDFPFLHDNTISGMVSKMEWVVDNYEDAAAHMKPILEEFRTDHIGLNGSIERWDRIREIVEDRCHKSTLKRIGRDTQDLFKKATLQLPKNFSLRMMVSAVIAAADVLTGENCLDNPRMGRPSKYMMYKWLIDNGFEDRLDSPVPWFKNRLRS